MSTTNLQGIYRVAGRTSSIGFNLVTLFVEEDGTLTDITITLKDPVISGFGAAKFQVNLNGNPVFNVTPVDLRPEIAVGDRVVTVGSLALAVVKGDIVTLDKVTVGTITIPLAFQLTFNVAGGGGGATALNDLTDVDTTGVADGDVLSFDNGSSAWVASTPTVGGAADLDDLTDVDTTTLAPVAGDALSFNGTLWVPLSPFNIKDLVYDEQFISTLANKWRLVTSGGAIASTPSSPDHPGVIRLDSITGAYSVIGLGLQDGSSTGTFNTTDDFDVTYIVRPVNNSGDEIYRIGLFDPNFSAVFDNAIFFHKEETANHFKGQCKSGGVSTQTASFGSFTANTWHILRIRRVDSGTVGFTWDGGAEVNVTTNIPTIDMVLAAYVARANTGTRTLDIDRVTVLVS